MRTLTRQDIDRLVMRFRHINFEAFEQKVVERDWVEYSEQEEGLNKEFVIDEMAEIRDLLRGGFGYGKYFKRAKEYAEHEGFEFGEDSYLKRLLTKKLAYVRQEALGAYLPSLSGDLSKLWEGRASYSEEAPQEEKKPLPIKEMLEKYFDFRKLTELHERDRTRHERQQKLSVIPWYFGNIDVRDITQADAQDFVAGMLKLPKLFANKVDNKSYDDLVAEREAESGKALSAKSIYGKYLSFFKTFFNWLESRGYIDKNPFSSVKAPTTSGDEKDRRAFTVDELALVFPDKYQPDSGPDLSHFWIPHILYYTGARLGEIAQLCVNDVHKHEGHWVFNLNTDGLIGQTLKTKSSKRLIPMRQELIDAGLLEYVHSMKADNQLQLWPNLKHNKNGYGDAVSKWFLSTRVRGQGITDKTVVTHSLRHTFSTLANDVSLTDTIIGQLMGHSDKSMSGRHYNSGQSVVLLKKAIDQLHFPKLASIERLIRQRNP